MTKKEKIIAWMIDIWNSGFEAGAGDDSVLDEEEMYEKLMEIEKEDLK